MSTTSNWLAFDLETCSQRQGFPSWKMGHGTDRESHDSCPTDLMLPCHIVCKLCMGGVEIGQQQQLIQVTFSQNRPLILDEKNIPTQIENLIFQNQRSCHAQLAQCPNGQTCSSEQLKAAVDQTKNSASCGPVGCWLCQTVIMLPFFVPRNSHPWLEMPCMSVLFWQRFVLCSQQLGKTSGAHKVRLDSNKLRQLIWTPSLISCELCPLRWVWGELLGVLMPGHPHTDTYST